MKKKRGDWQRRAAAFCMAVMMSALFGVCLPQTGLQAKAATVTQEPSASDLQNDAAALPNDAATEETPAQEGTAEQQNDAEVLEPEKDPSAAEAPEVKTPVQEGAETQEPGAEKAQESGDAKTQEPEAEKTQKPGAAEQQPEAGDAEAAEVPEGFTKAVDAAAPVYGGITIDGQFGDWAALEKTGKIEGTNDYLWDVACVWDGDYVYLYLMENPNWNDGNISGANIWYNNGNFMLQTERGDKTSLMIQRTELVQAPEGSMIAYANHEYEIAVPVKALNGFKENATHSLTFGVMGDAWVPGLVIVPDIKNISAIDTDDVTQSEKTSISYDYDFTDWDRYPHDTIQYSTAGLSGTDSVAALYSDGGRLFGHVMYYNAYYSWNDIFKYISLAVNEDYDNAMGLTCWGVDDAGNPLNWLAPNNTQVGSYEYHIFGMADGQQGGAWTTDYGRLYMTVSETGQVEAEFVIDLAKVATYYHLEETDLKTIHMQFIRIGNQWVSTAGTSTGPLAGILLCLGAVVAAQVYRRRKHGRVAAA